MEFVRRPSVLAALAAGLLVLNVVVLQSDDAGEGSMAEDVLGEGLDEVADGDAAEESPVVDDAAEDGSDDAQADATDDGTDGDGADGETGETPADEGTDDAEVGALTAPAAGVYSYAVSGSFSLTGPGYSGEQQSLPGTATGRVTADGGTWSMERVAGDEYADRFDFTIGPAAGLDWDGWELDRDFGQGLQTTVYDCSGDSAYYVNDAAPGRTAQHGCATQGISANGTIEYVGREDVTLGDGTVVAADRLLYTYTLAGTGVSGEGRLDLWLDPATGLRVREQRTIDSTTTGGDGSTFVYAEDAEFVLQSLTAG